MSHKCQNRLVTNVPIIIRQSEMYYNLYLILLDKESYFHILRELLYLD